MNNLTIRKNTIYDTQSSTIVAYDGFNVKIEDNFLSSTSTTNGVGAITVVFAKNLFVTGSILYGEIRIGNTQEADRYNRNIFSNNICINNSGKGTSRFASFINTDVSNCRFIDYFRYIADASTEFNKCQFEDSFDEVKFFLMEVNKKNCVFKIKHRASGVRMRSASEITDCEFNTNVFETEGSKKLDRNKVISQSYLIKTANSGVTSISGNEFLDQTGITQFVINTPTIIERNYFIPSTNVLYDYLDLKIELNGDLTWLRYNYQGVSANVPAFRVSGGITNATLLSEGNFSKTTASDFFVTATGVNVKSKDDRFPNLSQRSSTASIKKNESVYS